MFEVLKELEERYRIKVGLVTSTTPLLSGVSESLYSFINSGISMVLQFFFLTQKSVRQFDL